eukprot:8695242-Pyramimonas_sp.AAC.1
MRNPHLSIREIPGWRRVGDQVGQILEEVIEGHPAAIDRALHELGTKEAHGIPDAVVEEARRRVAALYDVQLPSAAAAGRAALAGALIAAANDPDDVLPEWLGGRTPMGMAVDIPTRGIFPALAAEPRGASCDGQ